MHSASRKVFSKYVLTGIVSGGPKKRNFKAKWALKDHQLLY